MQKNDPTTLDPKEFDLAARVFLKHLSKAQRKKNEKESVENEQIELENLEKILET